LQEAHDNVSVACRGVKRTMPLHKYKIDLRSDIHNAPTAEMRRAMAEAEVGGDALAGEDRAVLQLEEACAALFGKEDALFVCSGTMGNIVSLLTISRPGCALIADPYTHIVSSEMNGFERLAGCSLVGIETDGVLTGEMVRHRLMSCHNEGEAPAVICVENTHALRGGVPWGADIASGLATVAREHGLKLHIDGARIFNAAVAMGQTVADLTAGADTVQVCLSKGLGAPFGSLVVGSKGIICRAREFRQMLGGGMHKAGIMAAAGLVALCKMPSRIPDDHRRAARLGSLLAELKGLRLAYPVRTNIVDLLFDPERVAGEELVGRCAQRGLGITGPWDASSGQWIRLVTCHEISDGDVETAALILAESLRESQR
jgi:threonine aldolase